MKLIAFAAVVAALPFLGFFGLTQNKPVVGSGLVKAEVRKVPAFKSILLKGSINVKYVNTAAQKVSVSADDNLLPYIITEVKNGSLNIRYKDGSYTTKSKVLVTVNAPNITVCASTGSGNMDIQGVGGQSFSCSLSGAGNASITGRVTQFNVMTNGAGSVSAEKLDAIDVMASLSGAGSIRVSASKSLTASLSGAGSISYKGSPKITSQVSGSGKLKKL